MKVKEKVQALYKKLDGKWVEQFGFHIKDVTFNNIVDYMYAPKDSSSLAVTRILFGLAMLFDIPDERGGADLVRRWGDPRTCHFPLFPILQPMPLPYMALVYAALWFGALGIMLGYKYSITAPMFTVCYWYLFLIEKSFWNNHSYLFGLVALLISCTQANCYWSLDTYLDPLKKKQTVPYWNYFVLKYQFFVLYFMAGIKKGTAEWLTGYSVQNLSEHWVFDPFKYFLTVPQTDYFVVHWFVFVFDLTIAIWMMWAYTRHVAMVFCALFHLMNSRLFRIGMFPWVCLATMPLYYPFDWPKIVIAYIKAYCVKVKYWCHFNINHLEPNIIAYRSPSIMDNIQDTIEDNEGLNERSNFSEKLTGKPDKTDMSTLDKEPKYIDTKCECFQANSINGNLKKKITIYLVVCYVIIQAFLPFSHFITKGYNNWTNGLYGYSWDMMVHTWDSNSIVVKVIANDSKEEMFVDPHLYTLNDRWSKHGDMLHQYAQCLKNNLEMQSDNRSHVFNMNISIYVDIWYSINGRFVQRMFDNKVDLLKESWSPFSKIPYLMPLIDEASDWRKDLDEIRNEVHSWSNYSDVVFFADYPGYEQEKFIPMDFINVTLTILKGTVAYEPEVTKNQLGRSYKINTGDQIKLNPGAFHKVLNIGEGPAFYMYTFYNATATSVEKDKNPVKRKLPIFIELHKRFHGMIAFGKLILMNLMQLIKHSRCT